MKNLIIAAILALSTRVSAQILPAPSGSNDGNSYSGYLVNEAGLTYNSTYTIDMAKYDGSRISAQVIYTSTTFSAVTFDTNSYTLNGHIIAAPAHGLTRGLPVLYNVATGPAIVGLTTQTTYYIIPAGGGLVELATTSARAISGNYVTMASTTTSANSYTLTPLAIGGTATYIWQSSNDGSNWVTNPSSGTVTMGYTNPATDLAVDFGFYNYRYLRQNVTAPTSGGLFLQTVVNIKQDGIGRF